MNTFTPPPAPRALDDGQARTLALGSALGLLLLVGAPLLVVPLVGQHVEEEARKRAWLEGAPAGAHVVEKQVIEPWGRREVRFAWRASGVQHETTRVIVDEELFDALVEGGPALGRVFAGAPAVLGLSFDGEWWRGNLAVTAVMLPLLALIALIGAWLAWRSRLMRALLVGGEAQPFAIVGPRGAYGYTRVRWATGGVVIERRLEVPLIVTTASSPVVAPRPLALLVDRARPRLAVVAVPDYFSASASASVESARASALERFAASDPALPLAAARERFADPPTRKDAADDVVERIATSGDVARAFSRWVVDPAVVASLSVDERRALREVPLARAAFARSFRRLTLTVSVVVGAVTSLVPLLFGVAVPLWMPLATAAVIYALLLAMRMR